MYAAYVIPEEFRQHVASQYPPKYSEFIGHHITIEFGIDDSYELPPPATIELTHYVDDGSLDCFIAKVDGKNLRPTGGFFHLTWSLERDQGRKPVHSNDVIQKVNSSMHPTGIAKEATNGLIIENVEAKLLR